LELAIVWPLSRAKIKTSNHNKTKLPTLKFTEVLRDGV
jgi:hypothetical protein